VHDRHGAEALVPASRPPTLRFQVPPPAPHRSVLRGFHLPWIPIDCRGRWRPASGTHAVRRRAHALSGKPRLPVVAVLEPRGTDGGGGDVVDGVGGAGRAGWVEGVRLTSTPVKRYAHT